MSARAYAGVGVALGLGLLLGFLVGRGGSKPAPMGAAERPEDVVRAEVGRHPGPRDGHRPAKGNMAARSANRPAGSSDEQPLADPPSLPEAQRAAAEEFGRQMLSSEDAEELSSLRQQVAELRQEREELMGSPIDAPPEVAVRHTGPSLSGAVEAALTAEGIEGGVEGTDCAEHPCIVFGRLQGDEEDMEEIERSAAMAPYSDDVLTLLFWATSAEAAHAGGAKAPETGLFALAFYSLEERANRGEELDRRIRARVMEFWNTDRPQRRG